MGPYFVSRANCACVSGWVMKSTSANAASACGACFGTAAAVHWQNASFQLNSTGQALVLEHGDPAVRDQHLRHAALGEVLHALAEAVVEQHVVADLVELRERAVEVHRVQILARDAVGEQRSLGLEVGEVRQRSLAGELSMSKKSAQVFGAVAVVAAEADPDAGVVAAGRDVRNCSGTRSARATSGGSVSSAPWSREAHDVPAVEVDQVPVRTLVLEEQLELGRVRVRRDGAHAGLLRRTARGTPACAPSG